MNPEELLLGVGIASSLMGKNSRSMTGYRMSASDQRGVQNRLSKRRKAKKAASIARKQARK